MYAKLYDLLTFDVDLSRNSWKFWCQGNRTKTVALSSSLKA